MFARNFLIASSRVFSAFPFTRSAFPQVPSAFDRQGVCALQQQQLPLNFSSNFSSSSSTRSSSSDMPRGAVIALSHGGGPMPLLGDPEHAEIISSLRERVPKVLNLENEDAAARPRAIVVVTAHWSTRQPTISSGASHSLYYDYGGFPAAAYKYTYAAPGSPEVAKELSAALEAEGFKPELDSQRGWDHGVFVPMMLIRPAADIPVVQVSVLSSEDPEEHFRMGLALKKLRETNVAVVGSGFASFHNLRILFSGLVKDAGFKRRNKAWNEALGAAVKVEGEQQRFEELKGWRGLPGGDEMHPQGGGEHFMPLLVAAGAGGDNEAKSYSDRYLGLDMQSFYWT